MADIQTIPSYKEELKTLMGNLGNSLPAEALQTFNADAENLAKTHTDILKLKVGDLAPSFILPNAQAKIISSEELLQQGKVILTFYRGAWCPYCNLALSSYQQILGTIKEAGTQLVAISPMTPDNSLNMQQINNLQFEVLSDIGNTVAKQFTTVFRNADKPVDAMYDLGYDFDGFYGDNDRELPVPAVFIIDQNSTIIFAQAESGDYRERVEPQAILDALQ